MGGGISVITLVSTRIMHEDRLTSLTTARSMRELQNKVGTGLIESDCVLCCDTVLDSIKLDEANGSTFLILLHTTSDVSRLTLEQHCELDLIQVRWKITRKNRLRRLLGRIGLLGHGDWCGSNRSGLIIHWSSRDFGH